MKAFYLKLYIEAKYYARKPEDETIDRKIAAEVVSTERSTLWVAKAVQSRCRLPTSSTSAALHRTHSAE